MSFADLEIAVEADESDGTRAFSFPGCRDTARTHTVQESLPCRCCSA